MGLGPWPAGADGASCLAAGAAGAEAAGAGAAGRGDAGLGPGVGAGRAGAAFLADFFAGAAPASALSASFRRR